MSWIVKFLPRKWMSRQLGTIVHWKGPWSAPLIWIFAWFYNINLAEAEKPYWMYPSLGEFFVRKLKHNMRPLSNAWAVQPADSKVTEAGEIAEGTLIQAKGITYPLTQFIEDPDAMLKYDKGLFMTFYLCPTDYHRVHSPANGFIKNIIYIPGDLWPVNAWSTKNIPKLFRKNERVYVEIATEFGPMGVVFVGATNVGSIEIPKVPEIKTNRNLKPKRIQLQMPLEIQKGEELGLFRMGSTVILLVGPELRQKLNWQAHPGTRVRVKAALAQFK